MRHSIRTCLPCSFDGLMYCCRMSCIQYTSGDEEGEHIAGAIGFDFGPDAARRERKKRAQVAFQEIKPNRASVFSLGNLRWGFFNNSVAKRRQAALRAWGAPACGVYYGVGVNRLDMDRLSTVRCSAGLAGVVQVAPPRPQPTAGHSRSPCSTGGDKSADTLSLYLLAGGAAKPRHSPHCNHSLYSSIEPCYEPSPQAVTAPPHPPLLFPPT